MTITVWGGIFGVHADSRKDQESLSQNYPGHEQRMRNHINNYTQSIHAEIVQRIQDACGDKIKKNVTIKVANLRAHKEFFARLGQTLSCTIGGKSCILNMEKTRTKGMVLFVTYSIKEKP